MRSNGTKAEVFWRHVVKADGCWGWTGGVSRHGYGRISFSCTTQMAHRASYELNRGPIPPGLFVCHTCDVRSCTNPEHLFLGTAKDNTADMVAKGRKCAPIGPAHWSSKITPEVAAEIRAYPAMPKELAKILSAKHGIGVGHIRNLRAPSRANVWSTP